MTASNVPKRTNVYVDGFKLYYGALKRTPYKWLDISQLCVNVLPGISINRIRYFTALVNGTRDPNAPVRQQVYLRALRTIPNLSLHFGFFLTKPTKMRLVTPPPNTALVVKTEEKGSDVNLATYLMLDAFKKDFDQAVVISNDSDLIEPIRLVQSEFGLAVGAFNPHSRAAVEITKVARFRRDIRAKHLMAAQFASPITDANGAFTKPAVW